MDFKLFASTFLLIFLAELGDKTQLAALGLSAGGSSRLAVFLGASTALVVSSGIAVLVGDVVSRAVPDLWIERGAGALFLVLGVLFLLGKI